MAGSPPSAAGDTDRDNIILNFASLPASVIGSPVSIICFAASGLG